MMASSSQSAATNFLSQPPPCSDASRRQISDVPNAVAAASGGGGGAARRRQNNKWGCREKKGGKGGKGVDETQEVRRFQADLGSVFKQGSKKQSLNHLLNFNFEPRGQQAVRDGRQRQSSRSKTARGSTNVNKGPIFNKEQYLQANCQFVVRSSKENNINYQCHLADPDLLVDWNLIEEVKLKTSSMSSCPICLDTPKAAKITKCGHVYCHACILHYLALSDHAWRKCPICYDSIYKKDLKSALFLPYSELPIGDTVEMKLLKREKTSLLATPVEQSIDWHEKMFIFMKDEDMLNYSKLVLATSDDIATHIIARERAELEQQYREEGSEPEGCFIEEALQLLSQREQQLLGERKRSKGDELTELKEEVGAGVNLNPQPIPVKRSVTKPDQGPDGEITKKEKAQNAMKEDRRPSGEENAMGARNRYGSVSSEGSLEIDFTEEEVNAEDLDLSSVQNKSSEKDYFYFYQASDGQPLFLHAVNVKMLVEEFGSFERCPLRIRGRILEKDNTTMNEEMRSKLKYLKHLPLASVFEVCELSFESPKIGKVTMDKFKDWMDMRHKKRVKRERDEKRREKRIRLEEDRKMGKLAAPTPMMKLDSVEHFPDMASATAFPSFSSSEQFSNGAMGNFTKTDKENEKCSFAAMLREGQRSGNTFLHKSKTFPVALAIQDDQETEEGYLPAPPKASIGDALALALERASLNSTSEGQGGSKGKKKGKKNKGTKIDLTAMMRPSN